MACFASAIALQADAQTVAGVPPAAGRISKKHEFLARQHVSGIAETGPQKQVLILGKASEHARTKSMTQSPPKIKYAATP